jgi:hypothetical protein
MNIVKIKKNIALLFEIKTTHEMHGTYIKIVVWALNISIWPT